jgi:hypothetical protein
MKRGNANEEFFDICHPELAAAAFDAVSGSNSIVMRC